MGFIEETGAAQYMRDVRITPIYEGTNGIQAADLVNRKLARDGGSAMEAMQGEIAAVAEQLVQASHSELVALGKSLTSALAEHRVTTQHLLSQMGADRFNAFGGAFDYLMQTGYLFGGWQLARSALVAEAKLAADDNADFCRRKIATAAFYGARILPRCKAHAGTILEGGETLSSFSLDWF